MGAAVEIFVKLDASAKVRADFCVEVVEW